MLPHRHVGLDSVAKTRHSEPFEVPKPQTFSCGSKTALVSFGLKPYLHSHVDVADTPTCHYWHSVPV